MIEHYLDQVSSYAAEVDHLFLLITLFVGFWFLVAEGAILYFLVRFRRKEGEPSLRLDGSDKKHKRWINVPHLLIIACDVVIIAVSAKVWWQVKQDMPEADETIRVISRQWAWTFVHPGEDGEQGTADDVTLVDELHLETGKTYHYELTSRDVLHSFSIPVFRLKQDAVPGRKIRGWFRPVKPGEYDIQCAEMCGVGHGVMAARLYVRSPEEHKAWLKTVASEHPESLARASR